MANDIIIVDHMKEVVAAVSTSLQQKGFGMPVYYMYGHPAEITKRLQELTKSPGNSNKKFPLVVLFTDITIDHSTPGFYGSTNLHLLICNLTSKDYTSPERTEKNFIPILHPIKNELLLQLQRHPGFTWPEEPTYQETDCYYYGSQANDSNIFNDKVDAIELKNVRINLYEELCELISNF